MVDSSVAVSTDFKQRAREIFATQPTIVAGSMHMIGLDELKEALGERWPAVADRVHEFAERLLQRQLSANDAWFRYGSGSYVLVFAQLDKQAAQLICANIVAQLRRVLLGDVDTSGIVVQTAVCEVDGEVGLETARFDELLWSVARQTQAAATATPPVESVLDEARERMRLLDQAPAQASGPLRVLYLPVWDSRHQVVSTFICRANRQRPGRSDAWGYDAIERERDGPAILNLDLEVLSQSMATFAELFQNRFRCVIAVPVHFETVAVVGRRRDYVQTCRLIPPYLIPFVSFTLVELPRGIPYSRLTELVSVLKPFSRAVMAEVEADHPDLKVFAMAGVKLVGFRVASMVAEQRLLTEIERFGSAARKLNLQAWIEGLRSDTQVKAAEQAGFSFIAGPAIGDWSEVPEHMRRCTEGEVLLRARRRHEQP